MSIFEQPAQFAPSLFLWLLPTVPFDGSLARDTVSTNNTSLATTSRWEGSDRILWLPVPVGGRITGGHPLNPALVISMKNFLHLEWVGELPGRRENRRLVSNHVLTQHDVRAGGDFAQIAAYGGWSMEDHHPAGLLYPGEPTIYHAAPSPCGIPYRCLYSRNVFRETNNYQRVVTVPLDGLEARHVRLIADETCDEVDARVFAFEPMRAVQAKRPLPPGGLPFSVIRAQASPDDLLPPVSEADAITRKAANPA